MALNLILLTPGSTKDPKNMELVASVKEGNVQKVDELLNQITSDMNQMTLACRKNCNLEEDNNIEIIKLLAHHGAVVHESTIKQTLELKNKHIVKELVSHMIEYNKDVKFIQKLSLELCKSVFDNKEWDKEIAIETLELLLDNGLPINDFVNGDKTLLHISIQFDIPEFVSLLLERGADVHLKTSRGTPALCLGTLCDEITIPKLLLHKGAKINDTNMKGQTVLHDACNMSSSELVTMLLYYGADLNIVDNDGLTPLTNYKNEKILNAQTLVSEMAIMKYDNRYIHPTNLKYLYKKKGLKKYFDMCMNELERMSQVKLYFVYTLFDVLKRRKTHRELVDLVKNEAFLKALRWQSESQSLDTYEIYGWQLNRIIIMTMKRAYLLIYEEVKMNRAFQDVLPERARNDIAYFVVEPWFMH